MVQKRNSLRSLTASVLTAAAGLGLTGCVTSVSNPDTNNLFTRGAADKMLNAVVSERKVDYQAQVTRWREEISAKAKACGYEVPQESINSAIAYHLMRAYRDAANDSYGLDGDYFNERLDAEAGHATVGNEQMCSFEVEKYLAQLDQNKDKRIDWQEEVLQLIDQAYRKDYGVGFRTEMRNTISRFLKTPGAKNLLGSQREVLEELSR